MTRFSMLALLCFVFVMTNGREVYADPQVLAAVPVGEPLEFVCNETTCEVEFSAAPTCTCFANVRVRPGSSSQPSPLRSSA